MKWVSLVSKSRRRSVSSLIDWGTGPPLSFFEKIIKIFYLHYYFSDHFTTFLIPGPGHFKSGDPFRLGDFTSKNVYDSEQCSIKEEVEPWI